MKSLSEKFILVDENNKPILPTPFSVCEKNGKRFCSCGERYCSHCGMIFLGSIYSSVCSACARKRIKREIGKRKLQSKFCIVCGADKIQSPYLKTCGRRCEIIWREHKNKHIKTLTTKRKMEIKKTEEEKREITNERIRKRRQALMSVERWKREQSITDLNEKFDRRPTKTYADYQAEEELRVEREELKIYRK